MELRYGILLWNFVFCVSPREFVIRFRNFVRDVQSFLLEFRDGRWEIWFGLVGLVYFEKFARGVSFDKLEFRPRCTKCRFASPSGEVDFLMWAGK